MFGSRCSFCAEEITGVMHVLALALALALYLEVGEDLLVLAEGVRSGEDGEEGLQREVQSEGGELGAVIVELDKGLGGGGCEGEGEGSECSQSSCLAQLLHSTALQLRPVLDLQLSQPRTSPGNFSQSCYGDVTPTHTQPEEVWPARSQGGEAVIS